MNSLELIELAIMPKMHVHVAILVVSIKQALCDVKVVLLGCSAHHIFIFSLIGKHESIYDLKYTKIF